MGTLYITFYGKNKWSFNVFRRRFVSSDRTKRSRLPRFSRRSVGRDDSIERERDLDIYRLFDNETRLQAELCTRDGEKWTRQRAMT